MEKAACKGMTPDTPGGDDVFFPERGQSKLGEAAKRICTDCPVLLECHTYHKQTDSKYGIWAGVRYSPG